MEDEAADLLHEAAWEVYAVPPADFVATRTSWVKRLRQDGQRETAKAVGALRRPSVSAAAINTMVRAGHPVTEQLRDVGARMRHAQSALDAAGLAVLRQERDDLLTAWVRAVEEHAPGGSLTAAVETEVRDTAVAALADADATEVVLSGTLTRALAYSGFGEVDIADAVAMTSTGVVLTRIEGGREEEPPAGHEPEDDGDAEADEEADAADDVDSPPESADEEESAEEDAPELDDAAAPDRPDEKDQHDLLERLRDELDAAEAEVVQARDRRRAAVTADGRAGSQLGVAERGLEQARRLLEQAERHHADAQAARDAARAELDDAEAELSRARSRRTAARDALEEAEDAGSA